MSSSNSSESSTTTSSQEQQSSEASSGNSGSSILLLLGIVLIILGICGLGGVVYMQVVRPTLRNRRAMRGDVYENDDADDTDDYDDGYQVSWHSDTADIDPKSYDTIPGAEDNTDDTQNKN